MAHKGRRGKRRGPAKDATRPAAPAAGDRYEKFLPEWMRGNNAAAAPPRPARPRRYRAPRPAGGYTPGKFAMGDPLGLP
ncbi:MAG TPA: hypothetical protein VFC53_06425 [Dehalococcoidia bacterium]|nr:hypothetical protein [Dehalococcoidia bacterium]